MIQYDVIVIGSGLGGLSAAAILARRGKKVLVLEKHYVAGGYATNFKRRGYEFDVALHQIGAESSGLKTILKKAGVYDRVKFIKHKYLYESIYPDFEIKVENGSGNMFQKDLITLFPDEKFGIKKWFFVMKYIGMQVKIWDFANRYKFFLPLVMFFAPILIPILVFGGKLKLRTILDLCTQNPKLRKVLMEILGYFGDNLDISAIYYFIPSYGYYFHGGYSIQGGGQALSDAFVDVIVENGGTVLTNCEVQEIIVESEKATGVKTKKGEFYADHFICNTSPFILYETLLQKWEGSKEQREKVEKYPVGMSLGSIYFGVNLPIEELNPKFRESYIVVMNENYAIESQKDDTILCTLVGNNDNSNIPKEKTVITVALFDAYDQWTSLNHDEYKVKKDLKIEQILSKIERIFPTLRDHIEVMEYGTPLTMERYTGNRFGAVYGFSKSISDTGNYGNKTPISNLFLSSAWSFGGGFEGSIRAGNEACKKI